MNVKKKLIQNLINVPGWHTSRKIVIFESDDWGSIRMPSKKIYNYLLNKGFQVDRCHYNKNDSLENNDDVLGLIEVLSKFKDRNNQPAKFTLNSLVANPDFDKIKKSNFESYHYIEIEKTLQATNNHNKVIELYKRGLKENIFKVQFHGREHLNLNRWMNDLQKGNKIVKEVFENNMFTAHVEGIPNGRKEYLDAFGMGYAKEYESIQSIVSSGMTIFENLWGFKSKSFIAPNYFWNSQLEDEMYKNFSIYIQGTYVQKTPIKGIGLGFKKKYHYLGQKNQLGQIYLIRNASFEPVSNPDKDWVSSCMNEIMIAFKWKRPAIINSHRVNYIGSLNPENRSKNLKLLNKLLTKILKKFPEVEFMSSDELGDVINGN